MKINGNVPVIWINIYGGGHAPDWNINIYKGLQPKTECTPPIGGWIACNIYIYKGLQPKIECTPPRGWWTDWNIYIYKGLQLKTECTPPRGEWTDWYIYIFIYIYLWRTPTKDWEYSSKRWINRLKYTYIFIKDSNQKLSVLLQEVDEQTEIYIYL